MANEFTNHVCVLRNETLILKKPLEQLEPRGSDRFWAGKHLGVLRGGRSGQGTDALCSPPPTPCPVHLFHLVPSVIRFIIKM